MKKLIYLLLFFPLFIQAQSTIINGGGGTGVGNDEVTTSVLNPTVAPLAGQPQIWQNLIDGDIFKWNPITSSWEPLGLTSFDILSINDNLLSPDLFLWEITESITDSYQINYNGNTWFEINGATGTTNVPAMVISPQTTLQRDALTDVQTAGGLIFNSDISSFEYHDGTTWQQFGGANRDTISLFSFAMDTLSIQDGGIVRKVEIKASETVTQNINPAILAGGATITLPDTPLDGTDVLTFVNGVMYDTFAGSGLTIVGSVLTWDNATVGVALLATDRVVVQYQK